MDFLHSYARLLNTITSPLQGKQLHLFFLKNGVLFPTLSIANRLLQMYVRCGKLVDAHNLFDEMPHRNSFTWNVLLEGYSKSGNKDHLLNLFHSMPRRDAFSWDVALSGLVKGGDLDAARHLFNEMPRKNRISWNKIIHGYARNGGSETALRLFKDFLNWEIVEANGGDLSWDPFILATVVGACSDTDGLEMGKQVHARILIDCVEFDSVLRGSLTNMYAKCGDLDSASHLLNTADDPDNYSLSSLITGYSNLGRMNDARRLFECNQNPCVVLWNNIIGGYVVNGDPVEALIMFENMRKHGVVGDCTTFSTVLNACSDIGVLQNCVHMHPFGYKLGIMCDLVVSSAFIDAYAKCGSSRDACSLFDELKLYDTVLLNLMITVYFNYGRIDEARHLFEGMKSRSLISWNSMMVGLSNNGFPAEALELFSTMNQENLSMDKFTLASAITACASVSLLEFGEQIFARAVIIGIDSDHFISTSLIDFYCKTGLVELARKLFDQKRSPDEVSFNSMLMGYATNGYGHEALSLFNEMLCTDVLPTMITFTAVLSACAHCGLVEEGKKWFHQMQDYYNIDPGIEHYSCLIDLLARAGQLQEAISIINEGPSRDDAEMWSAILRGCVDSGDNALSKRVVERIIELDPENSGAFVQLSRVMASSGDWRESETLRRVMGEMGVQKRPGSSWCSV